ncbi:uncharacterized protein [Rutidosis leptorrhynchoides]|uniref:uncharacterized protein n=1 Tax=Rutidosis leptorrhynchoides TaxID=125765 RepID=UPI003A9A5C35
MIKVAIGGKSKNLLNHLVSNSPEKDDSKFEQWEQEDLIVFSWLIQNIEPSIASNLTEFATAKLLWDALVTTYSSGKDKLQNFDLHVKANDIKQKDKSLEDLWITLQGIWGEIDRRDLNPMKCSTDIVMYNQIRAEQKLFQFLNARNKQYDQTKRELLRWDPLPSTEEAYAAVRKEMAHQQILSGIDITPNQGRIGSGLATTEGVGPNTRDHRSSRGPPPRTTYGSASSHIDKSKLVCTKCGKQRHTREQCFEIKGYPEWWTKPGKVAAATAEPPPATTDREPNLGFGGVAATTNEQGMFLRPFSSPFQNCSSNKIRDKLNLGNRERIHEINLGIHMNLKNGRDKHAYIGNTKEVTCTDQSQTRIESKETVGLDGHKSHSGPVSGLDIRNKFIEKDRPDRSKKISLGNSRHYIGPVKKDRQKEKYKTCLEKSKLIIPCQNSFSALSKKQDDEMSRSEANIVSENFKTNSWILDCGATDTMTFDKNDIVFKTKPKRNKIQTANGELINVKGGGTIEISPTIKLPNCLYIPALSHKLLSVSHVTKELNCKVLMYPTFCILQDIRTGTVIGRGTEKKGLYYIDEFSQRGTVLLAHGTPTREAWLWHRRLGHPSVGYLRFLFPSLFPSNVNLCCETCILAKSHRSTFKPSNIRKNVPFALIHSDVWGPAPINGGKNFRYFVTFIDDCTRMTWIYFLTHKSDVYEKLSLL